LPSALGTTAVPVPWYPTGTPSNKIMSSLFFEQDKLHASDPLPGRIHVGKLLYTLFLALPIFDTCSTLYDLILVLVPVELVERHAANSVSGGTDVR
jgi:hypothetical protein